jgi:excisionase family DNA binding protein
MENNLTLDQIINMIPKIHKELQEQKQLLEMLVQKEALPKLLTVDEAAEILGIARTTLLNWVSQRKITVIKAGGNRFDPDDLVEFIKKNKIRGRRN